MNEMKAVVIEDEIPAARYLGNMIKELRPQWEVEMLPGSIEDSVRWFSENPHPDIIFLDIQLHDGISFFFLEQARPESMVVFTTAYDEYAVRAFDVNSIDYLLKPVHMKRLEEAICRCEEMAGLKGKAKEADTEGMTRNGAGTGTYDISELLRILQERKEMQYRTRILVPAPKGFRVMQVDDIAYFFTEDRATYAVGKDGTRHMVDFTLGTLEEQLDGKRFMRVNRQFILSADSVTGLENYFNGRMSVSVKPEFSGRIYVSREKASALKLWLGGN